MASERQKLGDGACDELRDAMLPALRCDKPQVEVNTATLRTLLLDYVDKVSDAREWENICDEISAACVDKIIGESVVDYITELEEIKRRYNAT